MKSSKAFGMMIVFAAVGFASSAEAAIKAACGANGKIEFTVSSADGVAYTFEGIKDGEAPQPLRIVKGDSETATLAPAKRPHPDLKTASFDGGARIDIDADLINPEMTPADIGNRLAVATLLSTKDTPIATFSCIRVKATN